MIYFIDAMISIVCFIAISYMLSNKGIRQSLEAEAERRMRDKDGSID